MTIASDNPTLDRWFNTEAGFRGIREGNKQLPQRQFLFRIEGVRGPDLKMCVLGSCECDGAPGRVRA